MSGATWQTEALRQQMLVRALWGDAPPAVVGGWLREAPPRAARGLQVYQANAGALAERALAAAFPTVWQLAGETAFAALARAFWRADAPLLGDIAQWGAALPAFIGAAPQLAAEPYLADVARLDWAVHCAEQAADGSGPATGLERLGDTDPAHLRLQLAPGTALVSSAHPVVTIWQAHRSDAVDRFEAVRAAFGRGAGEHALVHRIGFKAVVSAVTEAEASFMQALIEDRSLEHALAAVGADFAFEPWLLAALQQGWLAAVDVDQLSQPGSTA